MDTFHHVAATHSGGTRITATIWLMLMGSIVGCTESTPSQRKGASIADATTAPAPDADGPVLGKEDLWDANNVSIHVVTFFDQILKYACYDSGDILYHGILAHSGFGQSVDAFELVCLRWSILKDGETLFVIVLSPRLLDHRVDQFRLGNRTYSIAVELEVAADLEAEIGPRGVTIRQWLRELCAQIDKFGFESMDQWKANIQSSPNKRLGHGTSHGGRQNIDE